MWEDAGEGRPAEVAALKAELRSKDLIEFEVLGVEGTQIGTVLAEVIGHLLDTNWGASVTFVYPLAALERRSLDWAVSNLAAPNAVCLSRRPAAEVDVSEAVDLC